MNLLTNSTSNDWSNALGWTLLHSLWQGLAILLIVFAGLRFIPAIYSRLRYAVACGGLLLFMLASFFTFIYLKSQQFTPVSIQAIVNHGIEIKQDPGVELSSLARVLSLISSTIQMNMPWILTTWIAGFLFFAIRLAGGAFYTYNLRSAAVPIDNEWSDHIQAISKKLGIQRLIALAESGAISTPVVIGYFKPVILIPVGMLTGLTTEQLETIFLHELAHIKRHDYLINFLQSVIETIFFFNPFIWSLSNLIRREREYCCDDLVVTQHGGARAYAQALVQLSEVRLSKHVFALSLVEDKNQLLNRIRRIMEKSVKNYSGKSRIITPAILLIAGLLCISWLGIHRENGFSRDPLLSADQDTPKRKNEKSARYSRKTVVTTDENGQPHEEIVEEFEGDEDLRPFVQVIPPIPDISPVIPMMPVPPVDPVLPDLDFEAIPDTIPPFGFHFNNQQHWENFAKYFEESFQHRFEDLQVMGDSGLSNLMQDFELNFKLDDWHGGFENFNIPQDAFKDLKDFDAGPFKHLEEQMERLREFDMDHFRDFGGEPRDGEGNFHRYQNALREQLIKDGYLSKSEKIKTIERTDDFFKVNGIEIKKSDHQKYEDLHEKYFPRRRLQKLE